MFSKDKIKDNAFNLLSFLTIFLVVFIMSYNMTYAPDEYNYSHITWTDTRISSFSDILLSQKILYLNWTGRILAHFLIQVFLYVNHIFYPICNALVFCIFIYSILKLSNTKVNGITIIGCFALSWMFLPVFGETTIWLSGSLNYLWTVTILFSMFVMYKHIDRIKSYIVIVIVSFLAGFTHENTAFLGASFLFYSFLLNRDNLSKRLVSIISFFCGVGALLLAPGTLNRAGSENASFAIDVFVRIFILFIIYTIIFILINWKKTQQIVNNILEKRPQKTNIIVYILIGIYIIFFTYREWKINNFTTIISHPQEILFKICWIMAILALVKSNSLKKCVSCFNLIIVAIVSLLPMEIMSEGIVERSYFAYTALFIVATIMVSKNVISIKMSKLVSLAVTLIALPTLILTLKFYSTNLAQWTDKLNSTVEYFHQANSDIAVIEKQPVPGRLISTKYVNAPSPLLSNANAITNFYTARYYKFEDVIGVSPNCAVVKITIDSGDKNNLMLDVTIDNNVIPHGNDNWLIEPSKADENSKEVYFEFPINASQFEIKSTNNSIFNITNIDIYTNSSIKNYSNENFKKIISDFNDDLIVTSNETVTIKKVWK